MSACGWRRCLDALVCTYAWYKIGNLDLRGTPCTFTHEDRNRWRQQALGMESALTICTWREWIYWTVCTQWAIKFIAPYLANDRFWIVRIRFVCVIISLSLHMHGLIVIENVCNRLTYLITSGIFLILFIYILYMEHKLNKAYIQLYPAFIERDGGFVFNVFSRFLNYIISVFDIFHDIVFKLLLSLLVPAP